MPAVEPDKSSDMAVQVCRDSTFDEQEEFFDEMIEFSDDYGPGKLHPVHFGDVFKGSRYKVLRKLGAGSFSTVWLVRDTILNKYVALKIATAKSSATEHESIILDHLSRQRLQHQGRMHVTALLDSFEHQGPNGLHRCLVFDVIGPNSSAMFNNLPPNFRPESKTGVPRENSRGRLPFWMAKSVIKQTLIGLDYLHKSGIAHGDLQPGNILFPVKDLSAFAESGLAQAAIAEDVFVKAINKEGEVVFSHFPRDEADPGSEINVRGHADGKPNSSKPYYIIEKEPLFRYVDLDHKLLVKISDLGGAFFISEPPAKPVTPLALRSPELILGEPIGRAQDIWSFGCLVFEFLTATTLFSVIPPLPSGSGYKTPLEGEDAPIGIEEGRSEPIETADDKSWGPESDFHENALPQHAASVEKDEDWLPGTDDSTDDEHVLQMADLLGPIPLFFLARYPRSSVYFDGNGHVTRHYIGEPIDEDEIMPLPQIEAYFDQRKGTDLPSEDAVLVKELLRFTLQFDPAKRPSAETLLTHPWFTGSPATI